MKVGLIPEFYKLIKSSIEIRESNVKSKVRFWVAKIVDFCELGLKK